MSDAITTVLDVPDEFAQPHDVRPLIAHLVDEDHDRLRWRARRACDERWPHWSRSYSGDHAVIAGWRGRVGVDVETLDRPLEPTWSLLDEGFRSSMMTAQERELDLAVDGPSARHAAVSLWSSKEALAKALGTPLEWDPARLGGPALWPSHEVGRWRARFLDESLLGVAGLAWVVYDIAP